MNNKEKVLFKFQKNQAEQVWFTIGEYQGEQIFHVRIYVKSRMGRDEKYYPTKKGLAFDLDQLGDFFTGVDKLKDFIKNAVE